MVNNVTLFQDQQFIDLVSKAAKDLEGRVSQELQNSWGQFCKKIEGSIKLVGPRLKKKTLTRMDGLSKRFQEINNKKMQGAISP